MTLKSHDLAHIRSVVLAGHAGAGKSTLAEQVLFRAGAIPRLGKVDDGTTVTDFDEEEIARKHTLSSSLAFAEWKDTKLNLIDTPGFANFLSDARAALRVAATPATRSACTQKENKSHAMHDLHRSRPRHASSQTMATVAEACMPGPPEPGWLARGAATAPYCATSTDSAFSRK